VLFDMDGLLTDSEPVWFEAEAGVMARLGGDWEPADQRELMGGPLSKTVSSMLAKAPGEPDVSPDEIGSWLMSDAVAIVKRRGVPMLPGAAELLAAVDRAGLPRALVTSSRRDFTAAVLEVTGMEFGVTVCGDDVARGKPAPDPYLRAAELLGVDARECVVLEDSANGIRAAEAAGCAVIAVPSMPLDSGAPPGRVIAGSLAEVDLSLLCATMEERAPARRRRP